MDGNWLVEGARRMADRLGWYDRSLPASYRDGASVPTVLPVPEIPRPLDDLTQAAERGMAEARADLDDWGGRPMTLEAVEAVLDELVRPALNADGGDITLVKIEEDDIYVRLVGSCQSCPSSVMTMRMGVERLLQDEFPQMRELIQVDGVFA